MCTHRLPNYVRQCIGSSACMRTPCACVASGRAQQANRMGLRGHPVRWACAVKSELKTATETIAGKSGLARLEGVYIAIVCRDG